MKLDGICNLNQLWREKKGGIHTKIQTSIQEDADAGSYNGQVGKSEREWITGWWGRNDIGVGFEEIYDSLWESSFQ